MSKPHSKLGRFFRDKHGQVVIAQKPNAPIAIWAVTEVINWFVTDQSTSDFLTILSTSALLVWAILEIAWGISQFRRVLGIVVLVGLFISVFW